MLDHPDYDRMMIEFGPRFDESPWSPEILENPAWGLAQDCGPSLSAAMSTPTQVLAVIGDADAS